MRGYKEYFDGKKITQMGLGVLGRGVNVAKFLAQNGAQLTITDLKEEDELASSIDELKDYKSQIEYVLGRHRLTDFDNRDMVIKGPGVPLNSEYIERARENDIPVEMDASLFTRLAGELTGEDEERVKIIGVTGSRGKTTVSYLIYHILQEAVAVGELGDSKCYMGGNALEGATLPILRRVQPGDYVVLELDSWQLQGFGDLKLSPHIAVFTSFLRDHMDYYDGDIKQYFKDKSNIFKYQREGDYLVVSQQAYSEINDRYKRDIESTMALAKENRIPESWKLKIPGRHNRENAALAVQVVELLGIRPEHIRKAVESFGGVPGRLEYVKKIKEVEIYNDTAATTPEATIAALHALAPEEEGKKKIVLITGGADKNLDYGHLAQAIDAKCKAVITLQGSATAKLRGHLKKPHSEVDNLQTAVHQAMLLANKGDILLFSPASASFEMFPNMYARGDKFVEVVRSL